MIAEMQLQIEALIFASENGISLGDLDELFSDESTGSNRESIENCLSKIAEKYSGSEFAFELQEIDNRFVFMTKPSYHDILQQQLKKSQHKRLSRTAMETLAIIAYKQPVSKVDIEQIRGVNCDYSIQKLLEKELINICGRSDGPGRPILYGTSEKFMDHFGLKSASDLPKLSDLENPVNEIGKQEAIAEQAIQESSDN